ncbi:MAG: FtsX-like permease family protein, partial [Actinobacteria bacterium]|nr:FtsX-like permease family protein [Actinomycetota bacterium]
MTVGVPELQAITDRVVAQAKPGEQVEAFVMRGGETAVRVYEGEVEHFVSAQSEGVGIRIIREGRTGFAHAASLDEAAIAEVLAEARDNSAFGTPDEWAGLAAPDGVPVRDTVGHDGAKIGDTLRSVSGGHTANLRVRFLLEPSPVERLERLTPQLPAHARAGSPERRGREVEKMLGAFQLNLTALSLIALVVGMFLVTNTVAANVVRRRAELGLLRSLGMGRQAVIALLVGESLLLALGGSLFGIFLGLQVAGYLLQGVSSTVTSHYVLLSMREVIVDPWSLAGAGLAGLLAAALAAWWPAREAAAVSPVEALQPGTAADTSSSRSRVPLVLAAICLFSTLLFSVTALYGRLPRTGFLAALGILLTTAFLAPGLGRLLGRLPSLPWPTWVLARSSFLRGLHRHGLAAAALSASVAMAVGVTIMVHSFRVTVDQWIGESIKADLFIAPSTNLVAGALEPLDPEAENLALATPGIRAVGSYREIRLFLDGQPAKLAACKLDVLRTYNPLTFLSQIVEDPYELCRTGDYAIVSENFARRRQLHAGDSVSLPTPGGLRPLKISAVFRDYTSESGLLLLDRTVYQRLTGDLSLTSLALHLEPGVPVQELADTLREKLRPRGEFLIYSQSALREEALRIFDRSFAVTALLRTLAIGVAALGVTLALTALIAERAREIGILRATGATRRQILGTVMAESAYLGATGITLGLGAGFAVALVLMQVINRAFFG